MNHLEFAAAESAALVPTAWEIWVSAAEAITGFTLDGDQATDGYSYGYAYDAWKDGKTPQAYVDSIKKRSCFHCDADLDRESGLWVDALSGDDGGTYDQCPVNPSKRHVPAA